MGIGRPRDLEKQRFWGAQLRAWQESGLTQAEFCRRQGLGCNTFATWKHRFARRKLEPTEDLGTAGCSHEPSPVRLVPVRIRSDVEVPTFVGDAPADSRAPLTLVTEGGYRIEVGDDFAPATLARLLVTLGRL